MAPNLTVNPYCLAPRVGQDGSAIFECSQDLSVNPWLALPPHHPVVVQTQSFWTAVGASIALRGMEATQWTALTWIDWHLGDVSGGHAVRGVYTRDEASEAPHYEIVLYNAADAPVVTIKGRGVIFRTRNFEKWREGSKGVARRAAASDAFVFASPEALGLLQHERAFVAPLSADGSHIDALVTAENGLAPSNPFIGGSGDHVNSTHLHELARQALFLIRGRTDIDTSGTMTMKRYVELGTPLRLNIREQAERRITFEVEQLGEMCSEIELRW